MVGGGGGVGGGIPSDYLVSTQLQLLLFCCWGCGCCLAVTTILPLFYMLRLLTNNVQMHNRLVPPHDILVKFQLIYSF